MLYDKHSSRYQITQPELYERLGFGKGDHLPTEGFEPRIVTDAHGNLATIKCLPANEIKPVNQWGRRPSNAKARIFMHCDACAKWIPFGRMMQHRKGREHKLNFEITVGRP